ncbi:Protein of unknown function DUF3752 [Cinara cedri]|uniref:DUF3752 domain-containing protein n=1 Tax=Cinara cedri TaxID=506608 RepID=A0A5E4M2V5_9HEMI|nr:Protein of unknown function DUF3752 [Cinara cedri]
MGKEHKKHKKHKHSKHKSKDEGYYVPVVPLKSSVTRKPVIPTKESNDPKSIGPCLPANLNDTKSIGPSLPTKQYDEKPNASSANQSNEKNDSYGPSLPPHLVQQKRMPGPSLPANFKIDEKTETVDDGILGFGPLPAELITSDKEQQFVQKQLELRAEYMKRKFAGEVYNENKQQTTREKWMLELPPEKAANLGLGARQFRKREGPDMDKRSEWTDTPTDKQRKAQEPQALEVSDIDTLKQVAIHKRDSQMEILAETSEKRKPYSLLEMHQEKLKKEKKEKIDNLPKERRPFSREIDLQSNKFDNAQKQSILKKASQLNNRFSQGESRFL